jgi:hypothetical protein
MQSAGLVSMESATQLVVRLDTDAVVRVQLARPLTPGQRVTASEIASAFAPGLVQLELGGYDLGTMAFAGLDVQIPEARPPARRPYAKRPRLGRKE